jgi:REP element-mobilizing transposase RayT
MKRDYIEFQDRSVAKGYLITFRCYGTWLHGDERGSVDRRYFNHVGDQKIRHSQSRENYQRGEMRSDSFLLGAAERKVVDEAIREVCAVRGYGLFAHHVRTNHVHVTVSNSGKPERMMDSFKAYATRALRKAGLIGEEQKVWSRHGSTRYLWTEDHIATAVDYVINGQGDELPKFD